MAKTAKSQFSILGMLGLLKKASGYDLKKHIDATTQYFWRETYSSIYPVLEVLEKQKLIKKVEQVRKKNDRKRNVYTLTPQGKEALINWLMQEPENIQLRNELMLKIFFGKMVPIEVSIEHIQKRKIELEHRLNHFREIKNQFSKDNSQEFFYSLITLDHGIKLVTSSLNWCKDAIKTLKSAQRKK